MNEQAETVGVENLTRRDQSRGIVGHVRDYLVGKPYVQFLELSYDELEERNLEIKQDRIEGTSREILKERFLKVLEREKAVKAVIVCFTDIEGKLQFLDYDKKYIVRSHNNLTFDGLTECYCDLTSLSCILTDEISSDTTTNTTPTTTVSTNSLIELEQVVSSLESRVDLLQDNLILLEEDLSTVESELSSQINGIAGLQQQVDTINTNVDANQQQVSTGLAVLQETIDNTQENLSAVNQQLSKEKALTAILFVIFFFILVIVAFVGIRSYITQKGSVKINPQVVNYITSHIKKGKKYPHIKANLIKAGWQEDHIEHAYKTTMKKNYHYEIIK